MEEGKKRILSVLSTFKGREGEPSNDIEVYILKSMWLMMMSEFESTIKTHVENHIDNVKKMNIEDVHVCLLVRNFLGDKKEELTLSKIVSFYKKNSKEINYRNFTQDRVPKYKSAAVTKLMNNMGIFLTDEEELLVSSLDSMASTRDSIAHGDTGVSITRKELTDNLDKLCTVIDTIKNKLL